MDYSSLLMKNNLSVTREFNEFIFNKMEVESNFIISTLENHRIVFEEAQVATNTSTGGMLDKLVEFFKNIFGVFSSKTKALFESNKEWMDSNFNKFDQIDYSTLEIQMLPFWNMDLNTLRNDYNTMINKVNKIRNDKKSLEKYKDLDIIKKDMYSEYLDNNGDLTNGLKNYYRIGNSKSNLELVSLKGPILKKRVEEFKTYCFNYEKDVIPFVRTMMDTAEKQIKDIEKTLNSRPIAESFCLVENTLYMNTDISKLSSFVLLEAEQTNTDTTQDKKTPPKPTQVEVVNTAKPNDQQQTNNDTDKYKGLSTLELIFIKNVLHVNQLSTTTLMTVLEERFRAYINALKAIINSAGKSSVNSPTNKDLKNTLGKK